jgi:hypothetical protein
MKGNSMSSPERMKDATTALRFMITKKHVKTAVCMDPQKCVIAQAIREALPDHVSAIHVGGKITKVVDTSGLTLRYMTPEKLAKELRNFDKTGLWGLPDGMYRLNAPHKHYQLRALARGLRNPSKPKSKRAKSGRRGFQKFEGKRVPTRHVVRVESIAAASRPTAAQTLREAAKRRQALIAGLR